MAVTDIIESLSSRLYHFVPAFIAIASLWLGWRLWAFTLWPARYPEAPKPLPYLVPGKLFIVQYNLEKY